jgi:hypothetical protein
MPAIIHFPTNCGGEMELATLWKMEMQYYGKMVCNFREKRLAKNNVGECPLEVSSIKLSEEFVKQLPQKTQERVASLEKSEIKIFPKRFYVFSLDVITGTIIKDYNIKKLTIDYKYKKLGKYRKKYKEQTTIDFSQYATMLIYISEIDELKGSVDNLLKEVKEIKKLIPSTKIGDTHASKITE